MGWRFVRGLGPQAQAGLTAARAEQRFTSIADVVRRARLDRVSALALARAGAMAAWEPEPRRAAWIALGACGDTLPLAPVRKAPFTPTPLSRTAQIALEYDATGYSLHGHLMERWRARLDRWKVENSAAVRQQRHRTTVLTAGLVIARQRPATANGVTFLLLEDEHGLLNVIVPATVAGADRQAVRHAAVLLVLGRVEWDGPVLHLLGTRFRDAGGGVSGHQSRDFR
jgi:error-prone DNA polymerase